jgi:hypothetical protein
MNAALPTNPGRVEIRCEDCARDLGRAAPTLAVAAWNTWGRWDLLGIGRRRPSAAVRPGPSPLRGIVTESTSREAEGRAINQHHLPQGRSVELACRRCKRRGWRRRRSLYELAEAAKAAGTSNAYLSLG